MQVDSLEQQSARWPVEGEQQSSPRFVELAIRARFDALLTKLVMGRWATQDEADLRACMQALRDHNIGAAQGNIFSAISDDGLTFTREERMVIPHGSAFEAVALPDGRVAIISVCYDADTLIAVVALPVGWTWPIQMTV